MLNEEIIESCGVGEQDGKWVAFLEFSGIPSEELAEEMANMMSDVIRKHLNENGVVGRVKNSH
jgi:hypothetical protein